MISNRTANFKSNGKEEEMNQHNNENSFVKIKTTPLIKFDMNFHFKDEKDVESSSFTFKNDLLNENAYYFLKKKDECLASLILDDTLPNKNWIILKVKAEEIAKESIIYFKKIKPNEVEFILYILPFILFISKIITCNLDYFYRFNWFDINILFNIFNFSYL